MRYITRAMRYLIMRFGAAVIAEFGSHANITVRYSPLNSGYALRT
jgi:hypothetical protein